jgi:hypothetical protein
VKHLFRVFVLVVFALILGCKVSEISQKQKNTKYSIIIEAESSQSSLNKWQIVKKGDINYVKGSSKETYLEFMGNKPITGKANSPLAYKFTSPKTGNFKLMLMTSKRLEGVKSDWCNDAFVRLSGDYESANTLTTEDLQKDIKILQDGNDEVPELEWHWASTAEKDRHVYNEFIYKLKEGETYTLTLSGRSKRFSVDYIILYDTDTFETNEAKKQFKIKK